MRDSALEQASGRPTFLPRPWQMSVFSSPSFLIEQEVAPSPSCEVCRQVAGTPSLWFQLEGSVSTAAMSMRRPS